MCGRMSMIVVALFALAGSVVLTESCSHTPVAFSRGQPIPIGAYTIIVSNSEASSGGMTQTLTIHFRSHSASGLPDMGTFWVTLGGHMFVVDAVGNRYTARPSTLNYYLRGLGWSRPFGTDGNSSPDPSEWVAVSRVPANARGLSFLIENPARKSGQPWAAIVRLDR